MFNAKVYKVMVGCLSGAMEEVYAAKETIRKWNLENSEREGKLFLPAEWSSKPGDIKDVDVVINIVGNWIKNTFFIEECIQSGKKVMLFFNAFQDPKDTIPREKIVVGQFQSLMERRCYCEEYKGVSEFNCSINNRLSRI